MNKKIKKRKPYKKRTELKKIKDRVWELCKQIVKLRDKNICQKCDKYTEHGDASHVIPKSRSSFLRYDLLNLKLLCRGCHIFWWHKDILQAYEWFKKKFPERYEYLKEREYTYKKYTIQDLFEIEQNYILRYNELRGQYE